MKKFPFNQPLPKEERLRCYAVALEHLNNQYTILRFNVERLGLCHVLPCIAYLDEFPELSREVIFSILRFQIGVHPSLYITEVCKDLFPELKDYMRNLKNPIYLTMEQRLRFLNEAIETLSGNERTF